VISAKKSRKTIEWERQREHFPQFIVIHTVKVLVIVNKAEIDFFSGTLLLFP